MNATQLAAELGVTKARVSQYVSEGKLAGCYRGEGRARVFDLTACARALDKTLDAGQMLGNGAATRSALRELKQDKPKVAPRAESQDDDDDQPAARQRKSGSGATALPMADPDRYELARTQKAEEEARKLRRQNAEAEGLYLLAVEAERQVRRQIGQEIAEFETMLRDGARLVADQLGVDFKTTRKILVDRWRAHRLDRSQMSDEAALGDLNEEEKSKDI